ncbi:nitroreductase family protein [Vicingus serpentipes]|uniref:Nitroreductase family protein n=1 Tax=Vicingus serpentipes TaxID=1926625 RepID=A0A5C6RR06_9FLAO|nr:nitroreductase family protein [Vicingus serpentipes]TXB64683.1 nitroreductase family protein [Vicingus serpentipes]
MEDKFIPYKRKEIKPQEQLIKSEEYFNWLDQRRTVRDFSDEPVDIKVIENIIKAASTAPSGAHKQPWTFCVVANPEMKKKIREAAEKEEYENYHGRMSERWLKDLETFATDWHKPFLETAPYLIIVCKRAYEMVKGEKVNNYYVNESVGLATGMLLTAIHNAGLIALTHTPSPMNFLTKLLNRPENERPFLLIPVGYPSKDAQVPDIRRKPLEEVMIVY